MSATVDYGTLPAWIAAIATSVGFFWAILLFQLSRRQEHRAYARSVFAFYDPEQHSLEIVNSSSKPVVDISAYFAEPLVEIDHVPDVLLAEQTASVPTDARTQQTYEIRLQFTDVWGHHWLRTGTDLRRR